MSKNKGIRYLKLTDRMHEGLRLSMKRWDGHNSTEKLSSVVHELST